MLKRRLFDAGILNPMKNYIHRIRVKAPLEAVAAFHRDARALKRLTPPPIFVQMHHLEPIADGSQARFTMWLGPLPVRWVAVHQNVDPLYGFTDYQAQGPFRCWEHRHSFRPLAGSTTEVIDEVSAVFSRHPLWGLVGRMMWLGLPLLFAYRGWVTRRALDIKG